MPEVHAILSASSSKRWLNCTPSARLEQNFPNESSVYAEEGTAAHALGEYKLRKYLHERVRRPTSEFDNEEMDANTDIYAEFIITTVEKIKETCPHPLVMVEERLDYSYLVPQGFGTGDCVIIADGTLYVMDYKNGKGVFVSCDHNPQMMLYAIGAYHAYGYLYNITKVSMTIIQPRLENISTFECSVEELLDWAESYVRPRAKLAFEGKGEQVPGDWCRFCRARTSCKACAAEALALVKTEFLDLDTGVLTDEQEETDATAAYDPDTTAPTFKSPALLSKADIEKMLPTLNRIESWIEAIFAYENRQKFAGSPCRTGSPEQGKAGLHQPGAGNAPPGRWAHLRAVPSDHRPANDLRHHLAVPPSGGIGAGHPGQVLRPDAEPETGTAGGERERLVCGQDQLLHGAVYGLRLRAGRPCAVV